MLSFDIRSLETKAAHVDGSVAPDDPIWEKGDSRPPEPIRITDHDKCCQSAPDTASL